MKHKLLVALVASALEIYAASVAQAACLANGATPIRTGPLNPVDGFPEYVTDSNGLSVQRCLDPAFCFFDPVVDTDPFSVQINSGGEAFYWSATATLNDASGAGKLTLVMAAETAFLQADPITGAPIDGSQFPFLRLRLAFKAPVAGNYTLVHPYGTETFTVDVASGGRDVFNTIDVGFSPNATTTGPVGPFLVWDQGAPAGFVGNGNPTTGTLHAVTGSPCGVNSVTLTGTALGTGARLNLDGRGGNVLTTALFDVQGQIFDGRTQTPLNPTRLTYSRAVGQLGQIDAFAASTATAVVTVKDGPTIAAGSSRLPLAVTLGNALSAQGGGLDSASIAVTGPDTSALPKVLSVTATDLTAVPGTDATTLVHRLVDFVNISQADYDPTTHLLTVNATSGDARVPPTLTVREFGVAPGAPITTVAPPASVTVLSSAGGSDSALVRVIQAAAPAAPSGLAGTSPSSTSITLNWTDASDNETGFDIFRNAVKVASVTANTTTFTDTGLSASTAYSYQVFAINTLGSTGSNTVSVTTQALPVAPSGATAVANPTRTVTLNWLNNSADATGFRVMRSTALAGPYVQVATAAANALTAADTTAAPNTTYFYQVVAVRGTEVSTAATTSLTTPALPTAAAGLAATSNATGSQVTLSWIANPNPLTVLRSTAGGAAVQIGTLLAGSTGLIDIGTTAGTAYTYRVDASNWAGTSSSSVSLTSAGSGGTGALAAPGNLSASGFVTLNWADASTGETGYRWQRSRYTASATTGAITSTLGNTVSILANRTTATDTTVPANNTLYSYDVWAVNGTTAGLKSRVYYYTGGTGSRGVLPTESFSATAVSTIPLGTNPTTRNVTVRWTANTSSAVTGYEIERCVGTATTCAASGTWVNVLTRTGRGANTLSFVDANRPRSATYSYRIRPTLPFGLLPNWSTTTQVLVN